MKKIASILLCLLLLALAGCGTDEPAASTAETTLPQTTAPSETLPPETEPKETVPSEPTVEGKSVTLMVYMVGSDLEAKGGAGTNDLTEMADSGVDLSQVNVLVYTGGSRKWHNDTVESQEVHTLLELTETGFISVSTTPETSMGEADCLTGFLNTAYENYPADSYALILWDHGSGPLIGYGLDMLHDNDSLTLKEMDAALSASPFGPENKLAWMGFDACLMASAELACVVDDYAELLVASQEIEPAFGWNYSFLQNLGKTEPVSLLSDMTASYLATCESYYERKGYDHRDTTLACMDLSKADQLESAIEALFQKCAGDIGGSYNQLTTSRVNSRALGRATTGSEYDLIDLSDMASQMSALYPAETAAIQAAVESMVIANATNAEGLCGLSLYYPFYNKTYYQRSWGETYAELNVFPQYASYLDSYSGIWLGSDLLENVAASVMPSQKSDREFTLELTPEQAASYADARYYILQREGNELYTMVFVSGNVTRDGNTLVANFDGQVLYARNQYDVYCLPVALEYDTTGQYTHYGVPVCLDTPMSFDEDWEESYLICDFLLTADNSTKEIFTSALVPSNTGDGGLTGGKTEEVDLSPYSYYEFFQIGHQYLTRYSNGVIQPVLSWPSSSVISANVMRIGDGLEFVFAPLTSGEYYLIFEVGDTQGNLYCSELLPIQVSGSLEQTYHRDPIETEWTEGDRVLLMEEEGVRLYLTTVIDYMGDTAYTIYAENSNDFGVEVWASNLFANGSILCNAGSLILEVPAGSSATDEYGFDFGVTADMGLLKDLQSLGFTVTVNTERDDRTLIHEQSVSVKLTPDTTFIPAADIDYSDFYEYRLPTRGILAQEQVLFEESGLRCTLLGFGGNGEDNSGLRAVLLMENTSDEAKHYRIDGFVMDGIYIEATSSASLPAHCGIYQIIYLDEDELDDAMITSPGSLTMQLAMLESGTMEGSGGFAEIFWYPVELAQAGSGCAFVEGETVIYEENGVQIALSHTENVYGTVYWHLTVVNNSDQNINIGIQNKQVNGQAADSTALIGMYSGKCGAGQRTALKVYCEDLYGGRIELTFDFIIHDITSEKILWEGSQPVTLTYGI